MGASHRDSWVAPPGWVEMAKSALKAKGWTQRELARAVHDKEPNVSKLLRGRPGFRPLAYKVGEALGIGPPCVTVDTPDEADAFRAIKELRDRPGDLRKVVDLARHFLDRP